MLIFRRTAEIATHILIASSLVVANNFLFGFVVPRTALMLAAFLVCACAAWMSIRKEAHIRWTLLDGALAAWVGVITLAGIFGVDRTISFWSQASRGVGLVFIISWAAWFFAGKIFQWTAAEWRRFSYTTVGVLAVSAVIGIAQFFDPTFLATITGPRVGGTVGNALLFANYLMPHLFVFGVFASEKHYFGFSRNFVRIVLPVVGVLVLITMIVTQTRSAMAGLIAGAIVSGAMFFFYTRGDASYARTRAWAVRVCVIAVLGFAALFGFARVTQNPALLRITFGGSETSSITTRLLDWKVAFHGGAARPVLGWGPENYRVATDAFFDPELAHFSYYETRVDKPHNILLEMFVTSGILGLIAYCLIYVCGLRALWRGYKAGAVSALTAALLCGFLAAYLGELLFAFDTHGTLWIFGFVLLFISERTAPAEEHVYAVIPAVRAVVGVLLVAASVGVLVYGAWAPLRTGYHVQQAIAASEVGDIVSVDIHARAAFDGVQGPYYFETWRWMAQSLLYSYAAGKGSPDQLPTDLRTRWNEDVATIARLTAEYETQYPDSVQWQTFVGKVYYYIAIATDTPDNLTHAEKAFVRAHELSPERQEPVVLLVYVYALEDDYPHAATWFDRAAAVTSSAELKAASDFLVNRLAHFQKYDTIVTVLESLVGAQPTAENYAQLAAAYAQVKNYDAARSAVTRAVELDPTYKAEAQQFLQQLPQKHN